MTDPIKKKIPKEVQTSSKIQTLNLIYNLLKKGYKISHINSQGQEENSICAELNLTKSHVSYYLSSLKQLGYIKNEGYGTWIILKDFSEEQVKKEVQKRSSKNFSRGMRIDKPITNLHALEIKFPILSGKIEDSRWEIKNKLNNWLPKYKGLDSLGGLEIRNNNNKSLTVFAKSRNIINLDEVNNLAFKIRAYIGEYFRKKHNVELDIFNCETKNINLATEDRHSEDMIKKGEKFELKFDKKAEKIFPKDKIQSKAWIDGSPFKFTAETNDLEWKRYYLQMPFRIAGLSNSLPAIDEYNKNILLHMKVQEENLKLAKANQKTQREIQKLLKKLGEKS